LKYLFNFNGLNKTINLPNTVLYPGFTLDENPIDNDTLAPIPTSNHLEEK